jgi:hypothetical protein
MPLSKFSKYMNINRTLKRTGFRGRGRGMTLPKGDGFEPRLVCMKQAEFNQEFFRDLRGSGKGR